LKRDKIWECLKCGKCCKLFVGTGVSVSNREWDVLKEEVKKLELDPHILEYARRTKSLPLVGETPPKACIFLEGSLCSIYEKRPQKCREYPVMISSSEKVVRLHVSEDCPRGEKITQLLRNNPPEWIETVIEGKRLEVVASSFFDERMRQFLGEEP
jgi:Fe-S-cluster containining protein